MNITENFTLLFQMRYAFVRKAFPMLLPCLLLSVAHAQTQYIVDAGDTTTLGTLLRTKSNCTIVLQGTYTMRYPIVVKNASNLTLDGSGARWNLLNGFTFRDSSSQRIKIKNLVISDSSNQTADAFDFESCDFCGISNVDYTSLYAVRLFAKFFKGSTNGYVKNSNINMAYSGIQLGIGGSSGTSNEPSGKPTSACVIEGNTITNFVASAISTRSRNDVYDPASADSKLRHIIRNNVIKKPNIGNLGCGLSYDDCYIGIDVWGNEVAVEENTLEGNSTGNANIGIRFKNAYRSTCRNNKIFGPFTNQGISLFSVNNSLISDNYLENISSSNSSNYNLAGIGVSAESSSPISEENIISGNQIINCWRGVFLDQSNNNRITGNTIKVANAAIYSTGSLFELNDNTFTNNTYGIYQVGGAVNGTPLHIYGNSFDCTSRFIFNSDNSAGYGRPIVFENNRIIGWGDVTDQTYRAAIVLKCGPSKISNNTFVYTATSSFYHVAVAKSVGYSSSTSYLNVVTNNYNVNSSLYLGGIPSGYDNAPLNSTTGWFISPDYLNGNYP